MFKFKLKRLNPKFVKCIISIYETNLQEMNKILEAKFAPVFGREITVFFAHGIGNRKRYNCRCCHVNNLDQTSLMEHVKTKKHEQHLQDIAAKTLGGKIVKVKFIYVT